MVVARGVGEGSNHTSGSSVTVASDVVGCCDVLHEGTEKKKKNKHSKILTWGVHYILKNWQNH